LRITVINRNLLANSSKFRKTKTNYWIILNLLKEENGR
jgi:hypothetical protein